MKRGRLVKEIKTSMFANFPGFRGAPGEIKPLRKRRYSMASLWRIFDPLPVGLMIFALGVTQFNDLGGKTMSIGLVILLTMLLFGQVIEPCWQKQCERAQAIKP